ncbi:MAG: MATE family efflux transporter [Halobacteriaceae archaeon]
MNPVRAAARWLSAALARRGVIDAERGDRIAALAWPRVVTGVARMSQRVIDFAMVGAVLGPSALAGMAFALAYWQVGNTASLGVSGGTISQVSRRLGAEDSAAADRAIRQGLLVALAVGLPLVAVFWAVPAELVGLLTGDGAAVGFGATYLRVAGVAVVFEFLTKVCSRALLGADDAVTPMILRATGAVLNVVLNAVFIFGLGLGVLGAALGTLVATVAVTAAFLAGLLRGGLPVAGAFPVGLSLRRPFFDPDDARELVGVAAPLVARRLSVTVAAFPLLSIAATFGSGAVAAFEVARRVRGLANTPNWGFSVAASTLAGQELGAGDGDGARAYGRDVLRFSLVVAALVAAGVLAFARPIAAAFVEPALLDRTTAFVRVAGVGVLGLSVDAAATGTLRGAGDTAWPFYAKAAGLYLVALPAAALGTVTPLGAGGLLVALLAETLVPAAVTYRRLRSGAWVGVALGTAGPEE